MTGKAETIKDYHERINKVLEYIQCNLDEKLELETLASISSFSNFHFHRIMSAYLNEPLGEYIQRQRISYSATLLQTSEIPLNEIAYRCGYEAPSSFTKAFKKRFGVSPLVYRNTKDSKIQMERINLNIQTMDIALTPKIKELKEKTVIYIHSIGPYDGKQTEEAWHRLMDYAKEKRLFGFKTEMIGISYDSPDITAPEKLRYDACLRVSKKVTPDGEIGVKTIAGGRHAIFRYRGPYENFKHVYNYIYKKWLPESGEELEDAPPMEKYHNSPENAKPEKLLTEIIIPLRG